MTAGFVEVEVEDEWFWALPWPEGFGAGLDAGRDVDDFVVVVGVVDEVVVGFGFGVDEFEVEVEVEVVALPVDAVLVEVVTVVVCGHDCDALARVAVQPPVAPFAAEAKAITVATEATAAAATDSF